MGIYIESNRYEQISGVIAQTAYDQHVCVDLDVSEYIMQQHMIKRDPVTCDIYVTMADLQTVANTFCDGVDVDNI